ncbi:MAG: hypothetical protein KatS3mg014_2614 [Actinomycetota bacterium]|nr:MAG: hypothetical protein KatS3mg014_2614 [Actinomycetota bacterium]
MSANGSPGSGSGRGLHRDPGGQLVQAEGERQLPQALVHAVPPQLRQAIPESLQLPPEPLVPGRHVPLPVRGSLDPDHHVRLVEQVGLGHGDPIRPTDDPVLVVRRREPERPHPADHLGLGPYARGLELVPAILPTPELGLSPEERPQERNHRSPIEDPVVELVVEGEQAVVAGALARPRQVLAGGGVHVEDLEGPLGHPPPSFTVGEVVQQPLAPLVGLVEEEPDLRSVAGVVEEEAAQLGLVGAVGDLEARGEGVEQRPAEGAPLTVGRHGGVEEDQVMGAFRVQDHARADVLWTPAGRAGPPPVLRGVALGPLLARQPRPAAVAEAEPPLLPRAEAEVHEQQLPVADVGEPGQLFPASHQASGGRARTQSVVGADVEASPLTLLLVRGDPPPPAGHGVGELQGVPIGVLADERAVAGGATAGLGHGLAQEEVPARADLQGGPVAALPPGPRLGPLDPVAPPPVVDGVQGGELAEGEGGGPGDGFPAGR